MSASKSRIFSAPPDFFSREIKTSTIGWGIYMLALFLYCVLYHKIVFNHSAHIPESFIRVMREWGIWLLFTPVAFKLLRQYEGPPGKLVGHYMKMGTVILLLTLSFRVSIDYFTAARDIAASIVIMFPRYLAALISVILVWHIMLRTKNRVSAPTLLPVQSELSSPKEDYHYPKTILVNKGHDECLIQVDQIQCISAAGNYVDIFCNNEQYLMRATMKQIEEILHPDKFIRIHRSHIINIHEIARIKNQPSGNGTAQLRCGKVLSISKKYKTQLEQYRLKVA